MLKEVRKVYEEGTVIGVCLKVSVAALATAGAFLGGPLAPVPASAKRHRNQHGGA